MKPLDKSASIHRTRRNLPHWTQPGCTYFVTFRLGDSLPQNLLAQWREELKLWLRVHPQPWSPEDAREYWREFQARKERWLDAGHGSCALRDPARRVVVSEALRHFDGDRYELEAFVVMPNHVHVLVTPREENPETTAGTAVSHSLSLSGILHSWKSFTAHRLVKEFNQPGPVWMDENFDHAVRSTEQLDQFRAYIRDNPAKARLGQTAFAWWDKNVTQPPRV